MVGLAGFVLVLVSEPMCVFPQLLPSTFAVLCSACRFLFRILLPEPSHLDALLWRVP